MRYVYFIKEAIGENAPVKIGVARKVHKRFESIQCGNPRRLEILATIGPLTKAEAFQIEKTLHKRFRRHHIRGEWFSGVVLKQMHKLRETVEFEREK